MQKITREWRDASIAAMLRLGIPFVFVLIWSTGFIVAKAVLPHADLQLFLVARFSLTAMVMAGAAILAHAKWPGLRGAWPHVLSGAVMQGIYLCASYWAITRGMAAGVMALLGALQPLFTALFDVTALGKRLQPRDGWVWASDLRAWPWCWYRSCPATEVGSLTLLPVAAALVSVLAVTAGTIVQKWLAPPNCAWRRVFKAWVRRWWPPSWHCCWGRSAGMGRPYCGAPLVWAVLVPSVAGTTLLMWMMRHGDATKVTALLLLVPPIAALQAYLFFDETLAPVQFLGFALALGGVLLTPIPLPRRVESGLDLMSKDAQCS